MSYRQELPALLGCLGVGFAIYHSSKWLKSIYDSRKKEDFVPIGVVKSLRIFPVKSGKSHKVFSFFCGPRGPVLGELVDRQFQLIDGNSGNFYSARIKPQMVLIEVDVKDGRLHLRIPGQENEILIELEAVRKRADVRRYIWKGLGIDTLDCGDEASKALSPFLEDENVRLVLFDDGLPNERIVLSNQSWWNNNPVPDRCDRVNFHDFSPYMIQTEASLQNLNERMKGKPLSQEQFRPVIVIDRCPEWDEDRWLELKIGDVELECYRPCNRCILVAVDPKTGKRLAELEPLKTLRSYRLAPEGPMRKEFMDAPIFGICAGLRDGKAGYIHEGQVVFARYKPSAF